MSSSYGPRGKSSEYSWANVEAPAGDPVVDAWVEALFAKPITYAEYEDQRRIAALRTATKNRPEGAKPSSAGTTPKAFRPRVRGAR